MSGGNGPQLAVVGFFRIDIREQDRGTESAGCLTAVNVTGWGSLQNPA
jgi:hypothetical protein